MTYSREIGGDRIKNGSIGAVDVNTAEIATLAGNQTYAGVKTLSGTTNLRDTNFDFTLGGQVDVLSPATSSTFYDSRVVGDTATRHAVDADGTHTWGSGVVPADTFLYRTAPGVLTINGSDVATAANAGLLGTANTWTAANLFTAGVEVRDSTLSITQTGAPQATFAVDTNGQIILSNGYAAPVIAAYYDPTYPGMYFSSPVRFGNIERHENVAHYNPTATIAFDNQTNVNHAAIVTDMLAPGGPIYELNVSGASRWGTDGAGYQATLEHAFASGLRFTASAMQMIDSGIGVFQGFRVQSNSFGSGGFSLGITGEPTRRWSVDSIGLMQWSDGTGFLDTDLFRSGVAEVMTNGSIRVGTNLLVEGDTALGNTFTDLIGMYGATPVAQAPAIAAPIAPGIAYSQAEAQSAVDAINSIRAALTAIGITA